MCLYEQPSLHGLNREDLAELVGKALVPERLTPALVSRVLNRARRLRVYWLLSPLEKAILRAAARARVSEYRSPRVRELLAKLIARIEAQTPRGLALAAGLAYALSRGLFSSLPGFSQVLILIRRKMNYLLYLGRNLLIMQNYYIIR